MKASKNCLDMLAHHEGVRVKPYKCPAGLWTIGVGHLIGDGKSLPPEYNRTFTLKEVYDLLAQDVAKFERGVERLLPNVKLSQNQFDALVSFSFNLGLGRPSNLGIQSQFGLDEAKSAKKKKKKMMTKKNLISAMTTAKKLLTLTLKKAKMKKVM